ncbi:WD-40 repeat protein [Reticulomyxa filosa]|uniref:WD-40 repeat protein n=1 Tax=Reticulomyxa filosa TaxID=46433 RepID=X6P0Q5_RETFI|nr:WD-40 repeat protein [Reticulomyxa filosa]|eukprot:ETO32145.1 WD-40 repeat protein [Reticulomyxa filosa]
MLDTFHSSSNLINIFTGHNNCVNSIDYSTFDDNQFICSGSFDNTIRIWDIETTKQLNLFKGHDNDVNSVKYGSNGLVNTILSGSADKSVRLWDIRSGQQILVFNGHRISVNAVEYSPFVIKNNIGNSNVICSGSCDKTIRFWDIRSNNNELRVMKLDDEIFCLKFMELKKKANNNEQKSNDNICVNLCYGSIKGSINVWGEHI